MALIPNLTFTSVSADGTQSILTDSTIYGGSNPNRNQVAVYVYPVKVDEEQVETPLTIASFDPETATTFTVTNTVDGWYQYYFLIVNNWLIGTTYNQYDLVWDTTQNQFYQYINVTPSAGNVVTNLTYWMAVTNPALLIDTDSEPTNIVFQELGKIITYQTSICFIKAAAKHAKETCNTDSCGCDSRIGKLFHKIEDLFTNMEINSTTELFLEGELNAREVERYCDDCGCLDD